MELNISLVKRRVEEIKKAVNGLRSLASVGKDGFISDPNTCDAAKYRLILAIESAVSICNHIAARIGKKVPESYADCFLVLGDIGVISKGLSERLARMAKFRNLLVHLYWQVDDEKIFDIIQNDLQDLEEYIRELKAFLERES